MKYRILLLLLIPIFSSCDRSDTFHNRIFSLDEITLQKAIDSLYNKYPGYKSPNKWTLYNSFSGNGISFPGERRFYFSVPPEEMYYVTVSPHDREVKIAINAVHTNDGWQLAKDITPVEIERIEKRFDAKIVTKLERLTNSTCRIEE